MKVAVLGAGPAGMTAAKVLADGGAHVTVLEREPHVGGLASTHVRGPFRFDLGGHRFFTKVGDVFALFQEVLEGELVGVHRSSKIFFKRRYFDYPLEPLNAFFGLGPVTAAEIVATYLYEKFKFGRPPAHNLEDWVTREFGSKMFQLYFKEYTEKVWGIDCREIAAEWVAQRIKGMSLRVAIRNAFMKKPDEDPLSLLTYFHYPRLGIGRLSERMRDVVDAREGCGVLTSAPVVRLYHEDGRLTGVGYKRLGSGEGETRLDPDHTILSIPITDAVKMLRPKAPDDVLAAANALEFRSLVTVTLCFDAPQVTLDNWIYVPERHIKFGRIHEPKNWSKAMAPEGQTALVFEYFCFPDDEIWKMKDEDLIALTHRDFKTLNLPSDPKAALVDACVTRVPRAYPIYRIGFREHLMKVIGYMKRFEGLTLIGRSGTYKYNNIDHSMEYGMRAAQNLLGANHNLDLINSADEYLEEAMME